MDDAQERLLEDILSELKTFNDNYTSELERAANERSLQAIENNRNAEILAEAEKQALELADQQAQNDLEKELLEAERFEKIEGLFNSQIEKSENLEKRFIEMMELVESSEAVAVDQSNHQDIMIGFWLVIIAILITTVSKGTFESLTKSWR